MPPPRKIGDRVKKARRRPGPAKEIDKRSSVLTTTTIHYLPPHPQNIDQRTTYLGTGETTGRHPKERRKMAKICHPEEGRKMAKYAMYPPGEGAAECYDGRRFNQHKTPKTYSWLKGTTCEMPPPQKLGDRVKKTRRRCGTRHGGNIVAEMGMRSSKGAMRRTSVT